MFLMSTGVQAILDHSQVLIFSAVTLFALSFVSKSLRAWYRLRHVKGPFSAAFSNFWLIRHVGGGTMHLDLADVCNKYGTVTQALHLTGALMQVNWQEPLLGLGQTPWLRVIQTS
jgi:hypothetical protein